MTDDSRHSDESAQARRAADALIRRLRTPDAYPHPTTRIELIETHISWVLLTGPFAYKIKKPVVLPFVNFATLEQRRRYCGEELRLNRRLASGLYLDVVPIGGRPEAPRVGEEPALEYAVKLRQFDPDATADRRIDADRVGGAAIEGLAERLARFHATLPPQPAPQVERHALENLAELGQALAAAGVSRSLAALESWTARQCGALRDVFARRADGGAIREGHGDLHLENLVDIDGELVPFDALEFDVALRSIDVVDELAFPVMDLVAHGRPDLAARLLNRYLEISGDYPGVRLLRFYVVYRALVRAKVRAIKAAQTSRPQAVEITRYLDVAEERIRERPPLLMITHGLSGSGKTTVTDALLARFFAVRIRSDLERKRLDRVAAGAQDGLAVGAGRYTAQATDKTYATLAGFAAEALAGGTDTIVDATFLSRGRREAMRDVARRAAAGFVILHCAAPTERLEERIVARAAKGSDASEADLAVLANQLQHREDLDAAERAATLTIDTTTDVDYDALAEVLVEFRSSATNAAM